MKNGFTLIETVVVIFIIGLMATILLASYRQGEREFALTRSAYLVAQGIAEVREMSVSARAFKGEVPEGGYGTYLVEGDGSYLLFADKDGENDYDGALELVEEIALEEKVEISSLLPSSPLTITFSPPDPTVTINADDILATATIALKVIGTDTSQYAYNYSYSIGGWYWPRASCDISQYTANCPGSFSALATDPLIVYDQYRWCFWLWCWNYSKLYQRQETIISGPQKIIEVNKAGLIEIK